MKIMLFTTPACSYCGPAKELLKTSGIQGVEYIDATENLELAETYGVRSVPCVILSKCSGNQSFVGLDKIQEFIEIMKEGKNCKCGH
ncbi:MAG: glutaredoxin family protein [Fusobacteriaceae bacterium]